MLAGDIQTVTDLNQRARAHRIRTGQASADGVRLSDGTTAGVGDVVVTRLNRRALTTGRGWVKNGDDWIVTQVGDDGALGVTRSGSGTTSVLPADYVIQHVELGYASTAHRAQGRTVDAAHAYVTSQTAREPLYVMASRGRERNRLFVDLAQDPQDVSDHATARSANPIDILTTAISSPSADEAASAVRRRAEARDGPNGALGFAVPSHHPPDLAL